MRQCGVALLTVLFILALLTTLAVYLVADENLLFRRVSNMRDMEQAYQMVVGSEQWGAAVLRRDLRESRSDHLGEAWNQLASEVKVEQGSLATRIQDQQGLFNLNNLAAGKDQVWYPAFQRLLLVLELDPGLADAVVDWLDSDQNVTGAQGAEDNEYLSRELPYRAANNRFADVSELLWVAGFDDKVYARLSPYVTALPGNNALININTCAPLLLRVVAAPPLDEAGAIALAEGRGDSGYAGIALFLQSQPLAGQGKVAEKLVTVSSDYFAVLSSANSGRAGLAVRSLVLRSGDGASTRVDVLRRTRSSL